MKKFLLAIAAVSLGLAANAGTCYLLGNCTGWPSTAAPATSEDGVYVWENQLMSNEGNEFCWFAFTEASAEEIEAGDWTAINAQRYAPDPDNATDVSEDGVSNVIVAPGSTSVATYGVDASWQIQAGITVTLTLDTNNLTLTVSEPGAALNTVEVANAAEAVYYNLQGVRVANPVNGVFVKVAGNKAVKVAL